MDPQIWAPNVIQNIDDSTLKLYMSFTETACITGGGCNKDTALQTLYQSNGDIHLALQRLLARIPDGDNWTENEVHSFERLIATYGKNFRKISIDLKTRSVKECVQFYYRWKKILRFSHSSNTATSSVDRGNSTSSVEATSADKTQEPQQPIQTFPCKVCGRIFQKIKSRSAHMKRHKNERQ